MLTGRSYTTSLGRPCLRESEASAGEFPLVFDGLGVFRGHFYRVIDFPNPRQNCHRTTEQTMFPERLTFSIADWVNAWVDALVTNYGDLFRKISDTLLWAIVNLEGLLRATPWWLLLAIVAAIAWHATRRLLPTLVITGLLFLVGAVGLWDKLMQTLALMLVATFISVLIGIPLGILAARSNRLRAVLMPLLDIMQTMPSFVYLIPVLMLFGLGKVPAIFATVIYAAPPLIRLTDLGIRQVDSEVMEAVNAFGANRWQQLFGVQLPLALPSIMAGINQTTMMALSMVVIASMIGARGLGEDVLVGIQTLNVGKGLEAGLAIVILAVVIDRITQAYGRSRHETSK